jgi:hypothetical protein
VVTIDTLAEGRSDHSAADPHGYPVDYEDHALAFTELAFTAERSDSVKV